MHSVYIMICFFPFSIFFHEIFGAVREGWLPSWTWDIPSSSSLSPSSLSSYSLSYSSFAYSLSSSYSFPPSSLAAPSNSPHLLFSRTEFPFLPGGRDAGKFIIADIIITTVDIDQRNQNEQNQPLFPKLKSNKQSRRQLPASVNMRHVCVFVTLQLQTKHSDEGTPKETVLNLTDTLLEIFFWCFYRVSLITGPFAFCTLLNFMKSNSFHFVCVFSKMIYWPLASEGWRIVWSISWKMFALKCLTWIQNSKYQYLEHQISGKFQK